MVSMGSRSGTEIIVGFFVVLGAAAFGFIAVTMGGLIRFNEDNYALHAKFDSVSGLKKGSSVEIAGVRVGKVDNILLDGAKAKVYLSITKAVRLESDSVASVRSRGIIGEKFIKLSPGGADEYLSPGAEIVETEPAVDLEDLVGKFIYDDKSKKK